MPRHALVVLATAAILPAATGASPAGTPTADDVIARSIAARGGLAAIQAVRSVRMTGSMTMGPMSIPMTVEIERPDRLRVEMRLQGRLLVQAFDGRQAWTVPPSGQGAEALPEEAARPMAQQADFEGPLVGYRAKGNRVELVGREKVGDADAWRIKLTRASGEIEYYLIDAASWLPVRVESRRQLGDDEVEGDTTLGDYRAAGGWLWPCSIVNAVKGRPEKQSISFDRIDVNPVLDASRFRMPPARRP